MFVASDAKRPNSAGLSPAAAAGAARTKAGQRYAPGRFDVGSLRLQTAWVGAPHFGRLPEPTSPQAYPWPFRGHLSRLGAFRSDSPMLERAAARRPVLRVFKLRRESAIPLSLSDGGLEIGQDA